MQQSLSTDAGFKINYTVIYSEWKALLNSLR